MLVLYDNGADEFMAKKCYWWWGWLVYLMMRTVGWPDWQKNVIDGENGEDDLVWYEDTNSNFMTKSGVT